MRAWKVSAVLLALMLTSCVRPLLPPPPAVSASIRVICSECIAGQQVGYAPLRIHFYVDLDDVKWDFGDGTHGVGKLVEHTYSQAGLYKVTMTATGVEKKKKVTYSAQTYVKVLEREEAPAQQQVVIPNSLATITVLAPKALALGEQSLVCVYVTPRRDVIVVDMQAAENEALLADGQLFQTWLYVPAGAVIEQCFQVRAFRVGEGRIQFVFFVSDNIQGERSDGSLSILILVKGF